MEDQIVEAQPNEAAEAVQETKVSKYETEALNMGWRPETEWEGDPEDFVTAKEFVQRKSLFDKISTVQKENKELRTVVEKLKEHHNNIEEYTRKQVLADLQKARKAAFEEGNADAINEIDEAIIDYKLQEKERKEVKVEPQQPDPQQFLDWRNKNPWFGTNEVLTIAANGLAAKYIKEHGNGDPAAVLRYVETEVKKEFPEKFQNPNKQRATSVESSSPGKATKQSNTYTLTDEERRIAQKFVRAGAYKSVDDYAKELAKYKD